MGHYEHTTRMGGANMTIWIDGAHTHTGDSRSGVTVL